MHSTSSLRSTPSSRKTEGCIHSTSSLHSTSSSRRSQSSDLKRETEGHLPKLTKPLPKPAAPTPLKGHLWKEGPPGFRLQKYKWRYIAVTDTGVQWWKSKNEEQAGRPAKGRLDFAVNPCEVTIQDGKSGKIIVLKPSNGSWVEGNFTGADRGRELRFCCKGSEHDVGKWVKEMQAHMEHGKAWRVRASMVAESFDRKKKEDEKSECSDRKETSDESDESDSESSDTSCSEEAQNAEAEAEILEAGKAVPTVDNEEDESLDELRILLCNMALPSPDSTNNLEYCPAQGALCPSEEATLNDVWRHSMQFMLQSDKSPKLEDLLYARPLEEASAFEKAPLAAVPLGFVDWLLSRQDEWEVLWPERNAEELAVQWCADYSTRWEFWKRQTLHEWLCDDGSGGHGISDMLKVRHPTIVEACKTMSLHSVDRIHRMRGPRSSHGILRSGFSEESSAPPAVGEADFFKLLVWDLVVETLVSNFQDLGNVVDLILAETAPSSGDSSRSLLGRVQSESDIALLLGLPAGLLDMQGDCTERLKKDFWEVRCQENGSMCILARKCLFEEPSDFDSYCKGAMLGCWLNLRPRASSVGEDLHIIACQAGQEAELIAEAEASITDRTILCGSLWKGSLHDHRLKLNIEDHPKLSRFFVQVDRLNETLGSVCRKLSPLQTQVTKMMTTEVELRDYILVGDGFQDGVVDGLLSVDECNGVASSPFGTLTTVVRSATVCL